MNTIKIQQAITLTYNATKLIVFDHVMAYELPDSYFHFWQTLRFIDFLLFHDGPYHIETSPQICSRNQWTGSYISGRLSERVQVSNNHKN